MWLWECDLKALRFRCHSEVYWQCEAGHGLPDDCHLSIFVHQFEKDRARRGPGHRLLEVSAFHVTFLLAFDRVHFYYHEAEPNVWEPGGHTSSRTIRRSGMKPRVLREEADAIAARLVAALGGGWRPRRRAA